MRYETDEDRRVERAAVEEFASALGPDVTVTKREGRIDFELWERGVLLALVEVKARGRRYSTLLLSKSKWEALLAVRERAQLGSFLLVRFPEGLRWSTVEPGLVSGWSWGGRTDRGDPADVEQCVHIPQKFFERVTA